MALKNPAENVAARIVHTESANYAGHQGRGPTTQVFAICWCGRSVLSSCSRCGYTRLHGKVIR